MKRIGLEEVHQHVLKIAKEFDRICSDYHIPYFMIGGTMLGAIRHKGFIPWDDDMDFGVPIEYYKQLEEVLTKELSYPYRCCTFKNHPGVLHNYIKIEDQTTCIDDVAIALPIEEKLGVNIDIFPLNRCASNGAKEQRIRRKAKLIGIVFSQSTTQPHSRTRKLLKSILRVLFGGSPRNLQNSVERQLYSIKEGEMLGNILGRWEEKEVIPLSWYGTGVRYSFEDTSFVGLLEYDKYLTQLYGDYMTYPAKEQQVAHVGNVYLR